MGTWSTGVSLPLSDAKYYKLSAYVKVPGASTNAQAVTLRYRFEPSGNRVDVGTKTINTEDWTLVESGLIQPALGDFWVSYWEVRSVNNGIMFFADDCALGENDPFVLTGRVVDSGGAGVDGATVSAASSTSASATVTTAGGGYYSISMAPIAGTYTVKASTPGLKGTVPVDVSSTPTAVGNIVLGPDPDYDPDLIFSAYSSVVNAGSPWATACPASGSLAPMGAPGVQSFGGVQWEKNVADGPGYRFGTYTDPIPVNGASVVVVAKPKRVTSNNWDSIVDVFYNRLVLGLRNDTGAINVWVNGNLTLSNGTIPDGQPTVLSLVVQPTGEYKVWANGVEMMNVTTTSDMTSLVPNVPGAYANAINVGRNDPDVWTTFNGYIGDTYLYKTALSDTKRAALEASLMAKFITNATQSFTITATAAANGAISPNGAVSVVQGYDQTFTMTPSVGYVVADVLVDGVSVGGVSSYTFSNVSAQHTISATFVTMPPQTITASVTGTGGTISPIGAVTVPAGSDQTFAILPESGYKIADVLVDGVSVGVPGTYTFAHVVAAHTISASFSAISMNVPRTDQLFFSVVTDSLPDNGFATGDWATYVPSGQKLTTMGGAPTVEVTDEVKWERNLATGTEANGFRYATYSSPIPVNGSTVVVVAKPLRDSTLTGPWDSLVDVFYSRLVLGIRNDTGQVIVRCNGAQVDGPSIPDGQSTVLSLVVQPDGSWKVWANTAQIMSGASTPMISWVPNIDGGYANAINVGRNDPDGWTAFNGNIGDVFLYKSALTLAERAQLEAILMTKFKSPLPPEFKWKGPNNGNWSAVANWNSAVPTESTTAVFSDSASAGANVVIDQPATVGGFLFNNLVPNTTISSPGGNSITLDNGYAGSTPNPAIANVEAGSHTISATIYAAGALQKIGPGTLTLTGNSGSVPGGIQAAEGTLVLGGTGNLYGMPDTQMTTMDVFGGELVISTDLVLPNNNSTKVMSKGKLTITAAYNTSGADQLIGTGDHGGGPGDVVISGNGSWTHSGSGVFVLGNDQPANVGKVVINDNGLLNRPGDPLSMAVGWAGGSTGIIEQNGGMVTPVQVAANWRTSYGPGVMLGQWTDDPCSATYSLNGGVLQTPSIGSVAWTGGSTGHVVDPATKGSSAILNLNGGVLRSSASDLTDTDAVEEGTAHLIFNTTHTYVKAGGAKIDTAGNTNSVAVVLEHDASGPAVDGGLTKVGLGTLTLLKDSTYTGPTKVQAGILACATVNALGDGALDISTGAKLQLDFTGTSKVSQLTFNGGAAQPNGTYGATGSGATTIDDVHFAGTGTVTVAPATPPTPELPATGFIITSGTPTFTFPTVAGYKYRLVYKDDLGAASWAPVIAPPDYPAPDGWSATSTGANMTIADPGTAGKPQRFYRLEAANP